nr:hypothetical protein [Tanacetum cinerariifolium]
MYWPMKIERSASWVLGTGTWVCWGEWIGTVPVGAGVPWSSLGTKRAQGKIEVLENQSWPLVKILLAQMQSCLLNLAANWWFGQLGISSGMGEWARGFSGQVVIRGWGSTGTHSTNLSGTKDAASQEVKKDVSSLRYIALLNWVYDALLESSSMETPIPTVCSPVPTACFTNSQEPSSDTRLILKRVANQVETPSLDNILTLANRIEDIFRVTTNSNESNGVEADVSNIVDP